MKKKLTADWQYSCQWKTSCVFCVFLYAHGFFHFPLGAAFFAVFLISAAINHRFVRYMQITSAAVLGYTGIYFDVFSGVSGSFCILSAVICGSAFSLFSFRRFEIKTAAAGLLIGAAGFHFLFSSKSPVPESADLFLLFCVLVLYFYSNRIKIITEARNQYIKELRENYPFIRYGRNIAGIIHSIRSKLMAVNGFTELIHKEGTGRIREYSALQAKAADRILLLLDNYIFSIKALSREDRDVVSVNSCLKSLLELYSTSILCRDNIDIRCEITALGKIRGSSQLLFRICENLLHNAIEALNAAEKKSIVLTAVDDDSWVKIEFEDSGRGIPGCYNCKKKKCLSCSKFAPGKTTKKRGGGMGLVFVQDSVRAMNGRLFIESSEGKGTKVELLFPKNKGDF